jgi:ribosomal protein S18 acetylase RimI-like enzyme
MNEIQVTLPLQLPQGDVLHLLKRGNDDFIPSIDSVVDLTNYSMKLSENAFFILAKYGDCIIGCIAFYYNHGGLFIYISHFWVSHLFQKQHIGSKMLDKLISCANGCYVDILLEVFKENSAIRFYERNGFVVKEDRGNKSLLVKHLSN